MTPPGASPEAAAIEAAYVVPSTYFPASGATLYGDRTASLATIPDGQSKIDGIATGDTAAAAMIALRGNDGSSPPQFKVPGPAGSGRVAGNTELPNREWSSGGSRLSVAVRDAVRNLECQ